MAISCSAHIKHEKNSFGIMVVNDYHSFLMFSISGVQILAEESIVFIPVISGSMALPGNC